MRKTLFILCFAFYSIYAPAQSRDVIQFADAKSFDSSKSKFKQMVSDSELLRYDRSKITNFDNPFIVDLVYIISEDGSVSFECEKPIEPEFKRAITSAIQSQPKWIVPPGVGEQRFKARINFDYIIPSPAPDYYSKEASIINGKLKKMNVFMGERVAPCFESYDREEALKGFRLAVMQTMRYPENAARNRVEGLVLTRFILEKDGSVTFHEVVSSPDDELSAEAERAIKEQHNWKQPAFRWNFRTECYEPVSIKFSIPLVFKMRE
ncbi:MAG: energy transducer TonB [Rikenellaceae bacterium]